jgi:hypothetical protein
MSSVEKPRGKYLDTEMSLTKTARPEGRAGHPPTHSSDGIACAQYIEVTVINFHAMSCFDDFPLLGLPDRRKIRG